MLLHFALAALYSFTTPIFGSYDEPGHYAYARYVAAHWRLPGRDELVQGRQPPLYYLPVALAIAAVDTSDNLQPQFALGSRIMVVPDIEHDRLPLRGTALALHLGRLMSALISTLGVLFTFLAAQESRIKNQESRVEREQSTTRHLPLATCHSPATLIPTFIYACWPMFLHLSGAITNDVGIGVMGALVLWRVLRVRNLPNLPNLLWLGLSLVLALLTKDSGLSLVAFAGLVCLSIALQRRVALMQFVAQNRRVVLALLLGVVILGGVGVLASQGRITKQVSSAIEFISTAFNPYAPHTVAEQPRSYDRLRALVEALQSYLPAMIFRTTYGLFGWGHAQMSLPDSWYHAALLGWGLCLLGLIFDFRGGARKFKIQNLKSKILWLCLACVVAAPFVRAAYYADYTIMIGRYYMPALSALCLLIATGLAALPAWLRRISTLYVTAGIAWTALMTPFLVLAPMYRPPTLLDAVAMPTTMQVAQPFVFGDAIQLLGYRQPQPKVAAGTFAPITLYWRVIKPVTADYVLNVEAFEANGRSLGRSAQVHPGDGTFPSSRWRAGDTFAQTVFVSVGDAEATRVTFRLNWLDSQTRQTLIAPEAAPKVGAVAVGPNPILMAGKAVPQAQLTAPNGTKGTIDLIDSQRQVLSDTLALTLTWQAKANALPPATVFVHVIDAQGKLVAQFDSPMRGGAYPSEVWSDGEVVRDGLTVSGLAVLPRGEYRVFVGVYDPQTGQRWAVTGAVDKWIPLGAFTRN